MGGKGKQQSIPWKKDGATLTENAELRKHITQYYKKLFGKKETADIHLNSGVWTRQQLITPEENEELTKPFTLEELDVALKEMRNGTAPGPDGLSIEFYKEFWPLLRNDIKEMLDELHEGSLDLWRLNYRVIILIPKLKLPNNIKQFRPICLLNIIYKIITKVLTRRLTPVASRVISKNQTAFIPGKNILDGVVILHEVLHSLHVKKEKGIILKLDFEKAYDRVSWSFLEEVLRSRNFSHTWINWIMKAMKGGRVAIDINGERGEFFKSFRCLRQGDPLSPLLFNFVGDALSAMLSAARAAGDIEGVTPDLVEGGLTHLQYADDTIIFIGNSDLNVRNLKFILYCFEAMSGMKINYDKSEIFSVGVELAEQSRIAAIFGCKIGKFPMTYLGLPVSDSKLSKAQLSYVGDKVRKRLSMCKCDNLSSGGKSGAHQLLLI